MNHFVLWVKFKEKVPLTSSSAHSPMIPAAGKRKKSAAGNKSKQITCQLRISILLSLFNRTEVFIVRLWLNNKQKKKDFVAHF